MRLPIAPRERFAGIENGDGPTFESATPPMIVLVGADRVCSDDDVSDGLFKRRLVGLDLNDQGDLGLAGRFECFFDSALHRA
jgi:hypothetical protein